MQSYDNCKVLQNFRGGTLMNCVNCGQENKENNEICVNCGAPQNLTKEEVQPNVADAEKETETPLMPVEENTEQETYTPTVETKKSKKKIIIPIIVFLVLAIAAVAFFLLKGSDKVEEKKNLFYVKDDSLYVVDDKDSSVSYLIDDIEVGKDCAAKYSASYAQICGKSIFYLQDIDSYSDYSLYTKTVGSDDSVKVASGISSHEISTDGSRIVYLKNDDLYFNDLDQEVKLAKNVVGWCADDELKKAFYIVADSEEGATASVYSVDISAEAKPVKISNNVSKVKYVSDDLSKMIYLKNGSVYFYSNGESQKAVSDAKDTYGLYNGGNAFYFTKENSDGISKNIYFNDDIAEKDKKMTEPKKSDYQSYFKFGYSTYSYTSDAYYDALEEYENKENRDEVREKAKESFKSYDLYYFDGESEKLICKDIDTDIELCKDNKIVFSAYDSGKIKKFKMSDLNYVSDFEKFVLAARESTATTHYANAGVLTKQEFKNAENFKIKDNVLYYLADCKNDEKTKLTYGNLTSITQNEDGTITESVVLEDIFYTYYCFSDGSIGYFKDVKEVNETYSGDFYVGEKLISSDVYVKSIDYNNGNFYFFKDFDYKSFEGTLCIAKDSEVKNIADNVCVVWIVDGRVFYETDFNETGETYDLYEYKESKSVMIGDDISYHEISLRTLHSVYEKAAWISPEWQIKSDTESEESSLELSFEDIAWAAIL